MIKLLKDRTSLFFLAIAIAAGTACYLMFGSAPTIEAAESTGWLLIEVIPQLAAGLVLGGLLQAVMSREWMERSFGREAGLRGLLLAMFAGAVTPAGPFASFPLVLALWTAGAEVGALVTYLTAWALLGVYRMVVWEIPFLGLQFALLRFVLCLPMPIMSGYLARAISRRTGLGQRPAGDGK